MFEAVFAEAMALKPGSGASDVLHQPPVKLRPAITEEAEGGAVAAHPIKIDRRDQNARLLAAEVLDIVTPLVGDEAVAVAGLPVLGAAAVGRDNGPELCPDGAPHRPQPHHAGVAVGV